MERKPVFPLSIFYDGSCIVCATEMEHYRQKNHQGRLIFIDISAPGFEADRFGISRQEFMARMHVIDASGSIYRGVDAFSVIWGVFPELFYRLMARVIQWPGIHLVARFGYLLFARLRPYLPKSKSPCDSESCSVGHRR